MNDFIIGLLMMGAVSSSGSLPFWMTSNQFGLMPQENGSLFLLQAAGSGREESTVRLDWKASMASSVELKGDSRVMVDELYASIGWKALSVDLGAKHKGGESFSLSRDLGSLSATGGNVVWSGNSRSIPGYSLNLNGWKVPFTRDRVEVSGSFGDFRTLDSRYIDKALIHNTSAYVKVKAAKKLDVTIGFDHNAVWAGDVEAHEGLGRMPVNMTNYLRMALGMSAVGGSKSDSINVIGNQLGRELIRLDYSGFTLLGSEASLSLQHDIPYDDFSGTHFGNFPDGVTTLHLSLGGRRSWVTDILYEHHYTMFQSGTRHDRPTTEEERKHLDPSDEYHYYRHILGGLDNYFNNGEYRSGWTYYGRTIGSPLMLPVGTHDGTWDPSGIVLGVENTRLKAHHIGIGGYLFKRSPYKIILTYSKNYGTYSKPYEGESQMGKPWGTVKETPLRQVSGSFTGEIFLWERRRSCEASTRGCLRLTYGLYADKGSLLKDCYGVSLGLGYSLVSLSRL